MVAVESNRTPKPCAAVLEIPNYGTKTRFSKWGSKVARPIMKMVLRNSLLSALTLIGCMPMQANLGPQLQPLPKLGEVGVVFNIDLVNPKITERHWQAADGWAKFIRVSIGMDMEGYTPDANRPQYTRLKTLARECAKRGMGMHIILGGVPGKGADAWQRLSPVPGYEGKKYSEIPKSWMSAYAAWQERAAQEVVKAYGSGATGKIRFQLFNEPYDRGQDDAATKLMDLIMIRMMDRNGKVLGCPVDGPALWGPAPQMKKQIANWKGIMKKYPDTLGRVDRIPLNLYPESGVHRSEDALRAAYIRNARTMYDHAASNLEGHGIYFAEFGVSRVWDSRPDVFGSKTKDIAGRVLLDTLEEMRKYVPAITIYQSIETSAQNSQNEACALIDWNGNPTVDFARLKRIANK